MINLISLASNGINSAFGLRDTGIKGASKDHKGIDITLDNDNIPAAMSGTVAAVGTSVSAGNWIKINQNDGTTATYMHLAKLPALKQGQQISEGQTIGLQGSTGVSSGKHLHYQVADSNGTFLNPVDYLSGGLSVSSISDEENTDTFIGKIIKFLSVLLLFALGAYLFLKAFDINIV